MRGIPLAAMGSALVTALMACSPPSDTGKSQVRAQVREAVQLVKERQMDVAAERLHRLLTTETGGPLAHQALATLHLLRGGLDSSRTYFERAAELDPSLAEAHQGLGVIDIYEGDYEGASREFALAIDLDSGHPSFFYNAGVVYEYRDMMAEAEVAYNGAIDLDPWHAASRRNLGSLLLLGNYSEAAMEQFATACRLEPGMASGWYGAGKAHASMGDDSLAIACLERARDLGEEDPQVLYRLGQLYRKHGRMENARVTLAAFQRSSAERETSVRRRELKLTDPDLALDQYNLSRLFARRDRPAAAAARRRRAIALGFEGLDSDVAAGEEKDGREVERRAGHEAMRFSNYGLAATHYRTALQFGNDAAGKRSLGLAYAMSRRYEKAAIAYEAALQLDPAMPEVYNDLAIVHSQGFEEHERALGLLQKAVELDPGEKLYLYNLAHIHYTLTQFSQAAAGFAQVLKLDASSALNLLCLGMSEARLGRTETAETHLRAALAINPKYADAQFELGKVYAAQGRQEEAREMLERCVALKPTHKYAHYALGQTYLQLGQSREAQKVLTQFRGLHPHPKQEQLVFYAPLDTT